MTKKLDDVAKLMRKAARLIDVRGLAKWVRKDSRGRLCVHGALAVADNMEAHLTSTLHMKAGYRLAGYLRSKRLANPLGYGCAEWNNHPARRKHQVVNALKAASTFGM